MSKRPWMPFYVGDYMGKTGHLTTVEHGAYLLLIMHYWTTGGLPDDDAQLARITKLSRRGWLNIKSNMARFFCEGWTHQRIDAELLKMRKLSEKRQAIGKEGGFWSAIGRKKRSGLTKYGTNSSTNCLPDAAPIGQAEVKTLTLTKIITPTVSEDTGLSELSEIVRRKGWA